jgi:hypothetical protein
VDVNLNISAGCLLPFDPHQLRRAANHPSFNEALKLRSRGLRWPVSYFLSSHGHGIYTSVTTMRYTHVARNVVAGPTPFARRSATVRPASARIAIPPVCSGHIDRSKERPVHEYVGRIGAERACLFPVPLRCLSSQLARASGRTGFSSIDGPASSPKLLTLRNRNAGRSRRQTSGRRRFAGSSTKSTVVSQAALPDRGRSGCAPCPKRPGAQLRRPNSFRAVPHCWGRGNPLDGWLVARDDPRCVAGREAVAPARDCGPC